MERVTFEPIGVIRSDHQQSAATPIQPVFARGSRGRAEIEEAYAEGLQDLDGFSHIYLLYHFHAAPPPRMRVVPYLEDRPHGLFATRAPGRPNPIGLSIVRLLGIEGTHLLLDELDVLDGTPLLDIKPFCPRFDHRDGARCSWLDEIEESEAERRGRRL